MTKTLKSNWDPMYKSYLYKIEQSKYMRDHFYDSRNTNIIEDRILADQESREAYSYIMALRDMIIEFREEVKIPPIEVEKNES